MKAAVSYDSKHETAFSYYHAMLVDTISRCDQIAADNRIDVTTNKGELGQIYRTLSLKYGMSRLVSINDIDRELKSLKGINERLDKLRVELGE